MDDNQAREDIQLIRDMLDKTRKATAESGTLFIFWGILIILAIIGVYVLVYFQKYNWIWLNWIVFAAIGWGYSAYYGYRRERVQQVRTYAQSTVFHLSISCSIGFLLVAFIFPALKVYPHTVIGILVSLIAGIMLFSLGGIYEWNLLKWCGLLWWLGAVGMTFIPADYRLLFFIPLIIVGYLVPGFIFRSKYKRAQSGK